MDSDSSFNGSTLMTDIPKNLLETLQAHGQDHVVMGWDRLSDAQRHTLVTQLSQVNLAELAQLFRKRDEPQAALPARDRIAALPVEDGEGLSVSAIARGQAALRNGEIAVLVVAGGQGTRLGFDKPKGMFPVGPVSGASLFQIHAEKVLALSRRYGQPIPFLVMTSHVTHAETEAFFHEHHYFGLDRHQVHFFQQGLMPALDLTTGKLLLSGPGELFLSPNGHGGTLTALADSGLLAQLRAEGVQHIFYFQVDNPLVNVAHPGFVGRHIETESEASSRVVFKEKPEEKVGVLALVDGRCAILEYSDMPPEMQAEREADGTLRFRAGNPAIHVFSLSFLTKVTTGAGRLPFHLARKKVPAYDPLQDRIITPTQENALKFELFVFDALPLADRWLAVSAKREDEFAPLKNATGADSPETCRKMQSDRFIRWLTAAGVQVPSGVTVEIRPTFALDAAELASKVSRDLTLSGPTLFE
jgi:UDP-N-acetylglucosamine/UDP-N-acetylgalactosamine diphosphorylase